jgi:ATP-dependent DNA helicase RecQ
MATPAPHALETRAQQLLQAFGLTHFRPGQREAILGALSGRDVLAVMPTGAGKSLVYQLPALANAGLTVVVSPLIALMDDQVTGLQRRGVAAAALTSALSAGQRAQVLGALPQLQLLYLSPERLQSAALQRTLQGRVARLVIDEAHCISAWGHDFRPDYRRLGALRRALGTPPVTALTATATPTVRRDIRALLALENPVEVLTGFDRPNLAYRVWWAPSERLKLQLVEHAVRTQQGASIVYTGTRAAAERLSAHLKRRNLPAHPYHAGMSAEARASTQRSFLEGRAPLLVATNAFGMGIDKPDIRMVLHVDAPTSLEALYQEAGRAGRDGAPALCTLLVGPGDLERQKRRVALSTPTLLDLKRLWVFLRNHGAFDGGASAPEAAARVTAEGAAAALGFSRNKLVGALDLFARHGLLRLERQRGALTLILESPTPPPFEALRDDVAALQKAKAALWEAVSRYALAPTCRRAQLLTYFGDVAQPQGACRCDVCTPEGRTPLLDDPTRVLRCCTWPRRRALIGTLTPPSEAEALLAWLRREGYLRAVLGWYHTSAAGQRALARAEVSTP